MRLPRGLLLQLAALSVIGGGLILFHTRFGPGTSGDSTSYLMGAQNLLAGEGFGRFSGGYEVKPITGFPPFYSAVLAAGMASGASGFQVARLLNAFLFAASIYLAGSLVWKGTGRAPFALAAGGLLLLSDTLVHWHSWLMSEGLYLALMLAGIHLYLRYWADRSRSMLLATAAVFALATLTRYIGISLLAAAGVLILLPAARAWPDRLRDLGAFSAVGLAPVIGWLIRNRMVAGTSVNRELSIHRLDTELIRWYLADISSWFVPNELPLPTLLRGALALMIASALLVVFLWRARREGELRGSPLKVRLDPTAVLPWFLLAAIAGHGVVLAANSLFLDASTSASAVPRYLAPAYVLVVLFGAVSVSRALGPDSSRGWRQIAAGYLLLLLAFRAGGVARLLARPLASIGYTGYQQRWTEVVQELEGIDPERTIITNNPELVYILADRPAYMRPIRFDHYQQAPRLDYQHQLEATRDRVAEGAILVIFRPIEAVDRATIEFAGAEPLASFPQAAFFGAAGSQ